ncbi:serine/threonine-protein kinase [Allorhodopirellula solitaria]|uniref:non-specific serine/threonine protein kinase n=1 Tax=Allorhodopirellula solitaria TaxID=2527987 RepID=A0A5C5XTL1_9BACT|nr:serine/threonine-protein kinase [Allorhodopirellula solitaria]TWT66028.1 Serine/threonine-protein kinase PrkC [Allorhodopirellula solitaria]
MNFTYSPNDTVLDRYTIRRGIGVGGFGEVYFAHSQAGKEVALKRIQRNLAVELRGVSHCLNLKHPHLVSLHDVCRDRDDQAWVVMEYVAGKNLRQVLDDADPSGRVCTATTSGGTALPSGLTLDEVRRWFCGMAAGTAHLHAAGLVHRDLKPGNLFDDNGIIKVGDYGLSKFISVSHRSGHTESIGTLHYMAPEIGRGQYGREIDIYSAGIILYELLAGSLPFDGETPQEIVVKHLTDKPDLSRVPSEFRRVIGDCLQKDPTSRPRDIAEMMALTPWANGYHAAETWTSARVAAGEPMGEPAGPTMAAETDATAPQAAGAETPHVVLRHSARRRAHNGANRRASYRASYRASDEPIARAVGNSVSDLRRWWQGSECSPLGKGVIAIAATVILLINSHWLLPLLSLVCCFYVPYFLIREVLLQGRQTTAGAATHQYGHSQTHRDHNMPVTHTPAQRTPVSTSTARPQPASRLSKSQTRKMLRQSLARRSRLTLAAEWAVSAVISLLVAFAFLVISAVIGLRHTELSPIAISPYVWMACVVWIGAFGLLGLAKAWESSDGEGFPRRLTAACLGAGIGLVTYLLADVLMVPLNHDLTREIGATPLPSSFYQDSGVPTAAAMMAHFAALFALLRMWKPVDPLRRRRLSLWAVAVAVVGEWLVQQFIPIPQPAGMLIAGGIILMSQISAPWVKSDSVSKLVSA